MGILTALTLILFAGIMNGSFALPTKHITKWNFENIWFQYALWGFIIMPWLLASFFIPQIFDVYSQAPGYMLWVMLIGGFIFGVGQMFFALALNMIGFGLGFVINLGLGITLGSLLPLITQHFYQLLQPFGLITIVGCGLAVFGLIKSNQAGNLHQKEQHELRSPEEKKKNLYSTGVILAILAGFSSAGQNFAFSLTAPMQQIALEQGATAFGAANIIWPGFLVCSFIPYALYMIILMFKNKSAHNYALAETGKYYFFTIIMGLFWYASLVFYSKASQIIGSLGPVVGWPLFMVLIILVSNFWGWRSGEWANCTKKVKHTLWIGLSSLVLSIIVLALASSIN